MQQPATRVNASEETIKIGPLGIRFLLTSDDSNGSVSVFEVLVPAGEKLAAPAHKNDAYEEILYGIGRPYLDGRRHAHRSWSRAGTVHPARRSISLQ